jgi:hypothetical protein
MKMKENMKLIYVAAAILLGSLAVIWVLNQIFHFRSLLPA